MTHLTRVSSGQNEHLASASEVDHQPCDVPRTIDKYFQAAFDESSTLVSDGSRCRCRQWKYALIIGGIGLSSAAEAAEILSLGYILGEKDFQENILRGDLAHGGALVASILNLGLIVGGLMAGSMEGRLGRKAMILQGLCVTSFGGIFCAMSSSVASFASCRFIVGLGIGVILSCSSALATELSPPRERGLIVSIANSFWTAGLIGNAICAFLVFGIFDLGWRVYLLIILLPSIIGLIVILWVTPESPRFLALHGEHKSAAISANQVAAAMGYNGPPIQATEIAYHFDDERTIHQDPRSSRHWRESLQHAISNVRILYQGELRKPTITMQVLWITVSTGAALAFWINTIFHQIELHNIYFNFILLNCACIPGNIASAALTDRIGRNKFFTGAMVLASLSLFSFAVIASGNDGENVAKRTNSIVFCASFYYASLTGVYTVLYVMVSELFPTNVRAMGVVLCATLGRVASFVAQFVNGALIGHPSILLAVGASVLLLGAIVSVVFPPHEMRLKPVLDREVSLAKTEEVSNEKNGMIEIRGSSMNNNYDSMVDSHSMHTILQYTNPGPSPQYR